MAIAVLAHGVEPPAPGNTFELVGTALVESNAGSGDEVGHCLRDENLRRPRQGSNACTDVYSDSPDVGVSQFDLAGVNPDADHNAEHPDGVAHRACTVDGAGRSVECRQEAVADELDLHTASAAQLGTDDGVVTVEQRSPSSVPDGGGVRC